MKKLYLAACIIIILAGFLTGCSQQEVDLTKGKNPEQIIQAVINKSRQIKSYRFEAYIHGANDTYVTGNVSSELPPAEYYDFFMGNSSQSVFSIYIKGSNIYIKSVNNSWKPVEENIMERGTMQVYLNQITSLNPEAILPELYKNRVSIKRLKDEKVDKHQTTVIEMVVDTDKLTSAKGKFISGQGKDLDKVKITLWVGKTDMLVYRYYIEGNLNNHGKNSDVTINTNMSGYNQTKFEPPDEIKQFQLKL